MKKLIRLFVALSCAAGLTLGAASRAADKEDNKAPKGSIRPVGEVKPADLPGLAKITFQQAVAAAQKAVPGAIIQAELEVEGGALMYSFRIVDAKKKVIEVEIDAGNGKVLDTENEEDEKEDKKK
jgi:uncharacterized membrane protein YkoI